MGSRKPRMNHPAEPAIVITGPTATGKTSLAIEIATRLRGEIISIDSRQIFRHMDIGTAKPDPNALAQVKHHFVNIKNPDESYSAGRFGQEVRQLINSLHQEKILPVLVGGSGLYLQAVLDGFFEDESDHEEIRSWLRERMAEEGLQSLHAELGKLDPLAQARLSPNDAPRVLRALELAHGQGGALSLQWQERPARPLECIPLAFCLTMARDRLYRRIDQRVEAMMRKGLLDEVRRLVEMGYGRDCRVMGTLGYQEILNYLDGRCSLAAAVNLIKRRSRQYAKRQLTWFRKDRRLRWLNLDVWARQGVLERITGHYEFQTRV